MLFLIYRKDKPNHLQVRLENHKKHLEYLAPYGNRIVIGGPTLGLNSATRDEVMTGSFLIIDVDSWEAVDDFVKNDPFTRAGLFSTTIIERWKHGKHTESSAAMPSNS